MIRIIDFRDFNGPYQDRLPRAAFDVDQAIEVVRPICDAVAEQGEAALTELSQRFDGVVPPEFRVPKRVLAEALTQLDPDLRAAFEVAIERRRQVAVALESEPAWRSIELAPGAVVGQAIVPVERVGLYVPGGLAPLASSVIMNVVPAQVAGVASIAVASPPQASFGYPHPNILAVCALLGVDEVYAVGGAQAVAMFAHGVPGLCAPVSLVTGPGNIYVVAAKRLLRGVVGIDSEAGPTEIAVLADGGADPAFVAADLISQAEHDPAAASVLVTDSMELALAVNQQIANQASATKHSERITISLSGPQSAIVIVRDLAQGIDVVNAYGAEHLEIQTAEATSHAKQIKNAGAIFVGAHSPVPLGDYSAGSTHVLPTAGAARHSSGLNVRSFMRAVHIIDYSAEALGEIGRGIETFALAEDLPAHAHAIALRSKR